MIELTIDQAKKHPFNFAYIWASDSFLSRINPKYAAIIRAKQANQNKLIYWSAQKYGKTEKEYTDAIRAQFITDFGMTPAEALNKLAQGETVAGKNWEKGVYGVGAIKNTTTTKFTQNSSVTVDPKTGHILVDGVDTYDPNDEYGCVYGTNKQGKAVACQFFYTAPDGTSYMSERNGIGRYYASTYANAQGDQETAGGKSITGADAGTVWETANLSLEWLQNIINWILSLFGINTNTTKETLNNENTLPNQKVDGFTYESGFGEAGMIALALVAGGALLFGKPGKKGKKK